MKRKLLWFKKQYNKWWQSEVEDGWQIVYAVLIATVFMGSMLASFWLFLFFGLPWMLFFFWLRYEKIM
jgi:hypothetical protein